MKHYGEFPTVWREQEVHEPVVGEQSEGHTR